MRTIALLLYSSALLFGQPAPGQPAQAEVKPDTVVAVSDGKKITAAEVTNLIEGLPPQIKQNYSRDPRGFLNQWFLLKRLVEQAEKAGLPEKSPYKEGLAVQRMQSLAQAQIEETSRTIQASVEDQKKYYESKKDNYTQAEVKIIYIAFANDPGATGVGGKKLPTEAEAKAKADGFVKELRAGADFIKYVKEHSEDPVSVGKNGDFGPVSRGDQLPEPVKSAIFALKPAQISDPVKQPNGFYIFRLEKMVAKPFEEVQATLQNEVRQQKLREWIESNQKAIEIKVENQAFFDAAKTQ
jgi:hypothetical protein